MHKLKLYGLFVGLTITIMLICDTLAFKVIKLRGIEFAASGLIYSFSFLLSSITTEVYGFNLAGRIIWIQLLCHVIFILTVTLAVYLPSPDHSNISILYFALYGNLWHVLLGSCIAIPSAYFINDIIISKLKIYMYGRLFILRFFVSNVIGNAILVCISYPVNFYSQYSLTHIAVIGFNTWIYKLIASMVLLPIGIILTKKIKKFEKLDYYDYGLTYNPMTVFGNCNGVNQYAQPN